jgi:hypothetical protein
MYKFIASIFAQSVAVYNIEYTEFCVMVHRESELNGKGPQPCSRMILTGCQSKVPAAPKTRVHRMSLGDESWMSDSGYSLFTS